MGLPTFQQAREGIYEVLRKRGWNMDTHLKVPHATSPNGLFRLWFKPQALHYTVVGHGFRHTAGDARTLAMDLDIRKIDPEVLVRWIGRNHREAI